MTPVKKKTAPKKTAKVTKKRNAGTKKVSKKPPSAKPSAARKTAKAAEKKSSATRGAPKKGTLM